MNKRWKNRPEGSTWGDFGYDDQVGRINLLTLSDGSRRLKRLRQWISFCLACLLIIRVETP